WSLLLFALAVLAKEEGITLVAIVFLTELLLPRRGSPNRLKALGGYVVVAGLMFLLLKLMFAASSDIARGNLSRWSYFMTQWRAWIHYLTLLVWPWDLNADNLEFGFSHSIWDTKVISALFANALLLGGAWLLRKRHPIFLFSLLWFYIALSPASSVVVLGEPVNDHRMYLAYFGLLGAVVPWLLKGLAAVCGAGLSPNTPPMTGWVTLAALAALFVGTQARNQVWSSQETLWGDTVAKNPRSGRALNNLSLAYFPKQEWDRALEILRRCEWVDPTYPQCKLNLGIVYGHLGRDVEAEDKFRQAIQLDPLRTDGRSFYASFLERRDRLDEALGLYQRIDTMAEGTDLNAKLGLARLHRRQGRAAEAERLLLEARQRFGDLPQIAAMTADGATR
ncbi:MAG TPA: tetratricopeptide repeat protein, partial [Bdellovibrionota bacterium]|nr:tetratricopeptide repeat protein [Bdellovibrionota bacterium]